MSSKCGSNKAQNTDHESGGGGVASTPTTLAHLLLILKFLPRKFCHSLVSFTSVPQTSRLLITCTELYTAEKVVLQKLPKVCDMSSSWRGDGNEFKLYKSPITQPRMVHQHHRRQCDGSSKTMFESPNTQPLILQQHHRRQRVGSSKTMSKPPNTHPLLLQQHHRCQCNGSSKTMFESPRTRP